MKRAPRRLRLSSETLHRLDHGDLAGIGGAVASVPPQFIGCNSATCATACGGCGGGTNTCTKVPSATQFICTT